MKGFTHLGWKGKKVEAKTGVDSMLLLYLSSFLFAKENLFPSSQWPHVRLPFCSPSQKAALSFLSSLHKPGCRLVGTVRHCCMGPAVAPGCVLTPTVPLHQLCRVFLPSGICCRDQGCP